MVLSILKDLICNIRNLLYWKHRLCDIFGLQRNSSSISHCLIFIISGTRSEFTFREGIGHIIFLLLQVYAIYMVIVTLLEST
jgi:hypothetical protein